MTSRRQFLKDASLAGAGIILSSSFAGCHNNETEVIIIGAGLAGLAAAYKLKQKKPGLKITILEARKRIGGRVHSFTTDTPEKFVIELGAEWIGDSHERILELCNQFRLPLIDNKMETHLQYRGSYSTPTQLRQMRDKNWEKQWEKLKKEYASIPKGQRDLKFDRYDWWRYLKNNGCPELELDLHELFDSTDFGETIRQVSAAAALSEYADPELKSTKNEMDWKIKGGNERLAEKLKGEIGENNIHKGDAVTMIEQRRGHRVKVTCASGKTYTGDKIICTIPSFAVKKIDWRPGLPELVSRAIDELQYARINKHPIQFSKKFWGADNFDMVTDGPRHYLYHATIGQHRDKGVLISSSIGDKSEMFGWNAKKDAWNAEVLQQSVQPGFGKITDLIEKQWNYYWGNDEYSYGSYAIFKPGQWKRVQKCFQNEFINTYFAGEHLADWQGFMEGAINSGEEAAEKILS
jgi:monoamine oxidase